MATTFHWLFVGGPAHGRAMHIDGQGDVNVTGGDGKTYRYIGRRVVVNGNAYQVGLCDGRPTADTPIQAIETLIRDVGLQLIADVPA
jgi:hypothetical protein